MHALLLIQSHLFNFQELGRSMIECLFPPPFPTSDEYDLCQSRSTWAALKEGRAFHSSLWLKLLTGSRAEGLHLENSQGGVASDRDIRYLYGGPWGVHVTPGSHEIASDTSALVMDQSQSPPGYCRVCMTTVDDIVFKRMAQTFVRGKCLLVLVPLYLILLYGFNRLISVLVDMDLVIICMNLFYFYVFVLPVFVWHFAPDSSLTSLLNNRLSYLVIHCMNNLPLFCRICKHVQIGTKNVKECTVFRDGAYFLSSLNALNLLRDTHNGEAFQGPAQTVSNTDHVPALICSAPFPWIAKYLSRQRSSQWPSHDALDDISILPGLLVPTGKKGHVECNLQWRQSCSLMEIRLAQDMPNLVKAAFRAFKATIKYFKKQHKCKVLAIDASVVCSFHLKNVLLWLLEEADTWQQNHSFRWLIQLLMHLDNHLKTRHLPHYFNPECNLLDTVDEDDLKLTRFCVSYVLNDPVKAILEACGMGYSDRGGGLCFASHRPVNHWFSEKCAILLCARLGYLWARPDRQQAADGQSSFQADDEQHATKALFQAGDQQQAIHGPADLQQHAADESISFQADDIQQGMEPLILSEDQQQTAKPLSPADDQQQKVEPFCSADDPHLAAKPFSPAYHGHQLVETFLQDYHKITSTPLDPYGLVKNLLLYVEKADALSQNYLMNQILVHLDDHLRSGYMSHYFKFECKLLNDTVYENDLVLPRVCVKKILQQNCSFHLMNQLLQLEEGALKKSCVMLILCNPCNPILAALASSFIFHRPVNHYERCANIAFGRGGRLAAEYILPADDQEADQQQAKGPFEDRDSKTSLCLVKQSLHLLYQLQPTKSFVHDYHRVTRIPQDPFDQVGNSRFLANHQHQAAEHIVTEHLRPDYQREPAFLFLRESHRVTSRDPFDLVHNMNSFGLKDRIDSFGLAYSQHRMTGGLKLQVGCLECDHQCGSEDYDLEVYPRFPDSQGQGENPSTCTSIVGSFLPAFTGTGNALAFHNTSLL